MKSTSIAYVSHGEALIEAIIGGSKTRNGGKLQDPLPSQSPKPDPESRNDAPNGAISRSADGSASMLSKEVLEYIHQNNRSSSKTGFEIVGAKVIRDPPDEEESPTQPKTPAAQKLSDKRKQGLRNPEIRKKNKQRWMYGSTKRNERPPTPHRFAPKPNETDNVTGSARAKREGNSDIKEEKKENSALLNRRAKLRRNRQRVDHKHDVQRRNSSKKSNGDSVDKGPKLVNKEQNKNKNKTRISTTIFEKTKLKAKPNEKVEKTSEKIEPKYNILLKAQAGKKEPRKIPFVSEESSPPTKTRSHKGCDKMCGVEMKASNDSPKSELDSANDKRTDSRQDQSSQGKTEHRDEAEQIESENDDNTSHTLSDLTELCRKAGSASTRTNKEKSPVVQGAKRQRKSLQTASQESPATPCPQKKPSIHEFSTDYFRDRRRAKRQAEKFLATKKSSVGSFSTLTPSVSDNDSHNDSGSNTDSDESSSSTENVDDECESVERAPVRTVEKASKSAHLQSTDSEISNFDGSIKVVSSDSITTIATEVQKDCENKSNDTFFTSSQAKSTLTNENEGQKSENSSLPVTPASSESMVPTESAPSQARLKRRKDIHPPKPEVKPIKSKLRDLFRRQSAGMRIGKSKSKKIKNDNVDGQSLRPAIHLRQENTPPSTSPPTFDDSNKRDTLRDPVVAGNVSIVAGNVSIEERKAIRRARDYFYEAKDLMKEATAIGNQDTIEVEILTKKAYSYANEAEKLIMDISDDAIIQEKLFSKDVTIRSCSSMSSVSTENTLSLRLNRLEELHRLHSMELFSFQSYMLCGGDLRLIEDTKHLRTETMQILEAIDQRLFPQPLQISPESSNSDKNISDKYEANDKGAQEQHTDWFSCGRLGGDGEKSSRKEHNADWCEKRKHDSQQMNKKPRLDSSNDWFDRSKHGANGSNYMSCRMNGQDWFVNDKTEAMENFRSSNTRAEATYTSSNQQSPIWRFGGGMDVPTAPSDASYSTAPEEMKILRSTDESIDYSYETDAETAFSYDESEMSASTMTTFTHGAGCQVFGMGRR